MSISEVIVKGTYKKADGSPETGTVKFRPALWQQSGGGIDAVLDSSGSFQTKFPSSDSGNWPDGLQIPYRVTVAVSSGTYVKELTFKTADSPIDLPTLFPIISDSGGSGGGGSGSAAHAGTHLVGGTDELRGLSLSQVSGLEARLAALETAVADRPLIRETSPNGTDRLVEIYDKTTGKWSMVFYDSGDRDLRGLAWPAFTSARHIKLRRINNTVYLQFAVALKDAVSLTVPGVLPLGFALEIRTCGIITNETRSDEMRITASGNTAGDVWVNKLASSGSWIGGNLIGLTKDPIPKSLPGLPI